MGLEAGGLISFILPARVEAAPGDPDPTFGNGGKVTNDFFGRTAHGLDAAIQPDGKIVATGSAFNSATNNFNFALARYFSKSPKQRCICRTRGVRMSQALLIA